MANRATSVHAICQFCQLEAVATFTCIGYATRSDTRQLTRRGEDAGMVDDRRLSKSSSISHLLMSHLQLATTTLGLHLSPSIAQAHLSSLLNLNHESDLLPTLRILLSSPPDLSNSSITRLDRRSEPRTILLDTSRVSATDELNKCMGTGVPGVETVDDNTTEA